MEIEDLCEKYVKSIERRRATKEKLNAKKTDVMTSATEKGETKSCETSTFEANPPKNAQLANHSGSQYSDNRQPDKSTMRIEPMGIKSPPRKNTDNSDTDSKAGRYSLIWVLRGNIAVTERQIKMWTRPNKGMSQLMKSICTEKDEGEVIKKKAKFKVIKQDFVNDRASDILEDPDELDKNSII